MPLLALARPSPICSAGEPWCHRGCRPSCRLAPPPWGRHASVVRMHEHGRPRLSLARLGAEAGHSRHAHRMSSSMASPRWSCSRAYSRPKARPSPTWWPGMSRHRLAPPPSSPLTAATVASPVRSRHAHAATSHSRRGEPTQHTQHTHAHTRWSSHRIEKKPHGIQEMATRGPKLSAAEKKRERRREGVEPSSA